MFDALVDNFNWTVSDSKSNNAKDVAEELG